MDSLVTPAWLADHRGDPDLVILDASLHLPASGRDAGAEFAAGRIPDARFLDLARFTDASDPAPAAVPNAGQFAERMAELGITPDTAVVLYDDSPLRSAARAWVIFRLYGHASVALLDGGLAAWKAAGHAVAGGPPEAAQRATYPVPRRDEGRLRDKAAMLANLASGEMAVVDARDAARFAGETADTVHNLPGGHIPGARNLPFAALLDGAGRWLPRPEIAERFRAAGIDPSAPLVASCGSGVTASVVLFAQHLLGGEGALYDGSWSEWGADPATPKATGPA